MRIAKSTLRLRPPDAAYRLPDLAQAEPDAIVSLVGAKAVVVRARAPIEDGAYEDDEGGQGFFHDTYLLFVCPDEPAQTKNCRFAPRRRQLRNVAWPSAVQPLTVEL
jgi:hypothetical protein